MGKSKQILNQINDVKKQILINNTKENITVEEINNEVDKLKQLENDYKKEVKNEKNDTFVNKFKKNEFKNFTLTSDGDYLVPVEQIIQVQNLEEFTDLSKIISNIKVKSIKGTFPTKIDGTITPLLKKSESDTTDIEKISQKAYKLEPFTGFFSIPNSLKDDSKGLEDFLSNYSNKKNIATKNSLILKALNTANLVQHEIGASADNILNDLIGLTPSSSILTNTHGFKILASHMKSEELKINSKQIILVEDEILPNETKYAPFYIGDLKEIYLVELDKLGIFRSPISGFTGNTTDVKLTSYLQEITGNLGRIKKILCDIS